MQRYVSFLSVVVLLVASGCASTAGTDPDLIAAAIANPERSAVDKERDARSKPAVVLGLLDLQPGDTAADIFGGGGYYAELIAGVVRPDGEVILQNNAPYAKWVMKDIQAKYIDASVPGITALLSEVDDLQLGTDQLDAALMVMSFHDLYYYAPERGWDNTDVDAFLAQVYMAVKKGGHFVIVDHAAAAGTGKEAAQNLHRIDESFVKQVVEKAGFKLVATSDALRNPQDDKSKLVFDKSIRGGTDRFILAFEKR